MKKSRIIWLLSALLILFAGCADKKDLLDASFQSDTSTSFDYAVSGSLKDLETEAVTTEPKEETEPATTEPKEETEPATTEPEKYVPEYGKNYYDLENVVLYLKEYSELPPNYITKNEARDLGWSGGSVEDYKEGAAIGGDSFGNYEGLLPDSGGVKYTECDIDTDGYSSRGSRRLVFSSNGRYYYTDDHYNSFKEVFIGENNEVTVEE